MTPQPNPPTQPRKPTHSGSSRSYTPRLAVVQVLQAVAQHVPISDGGTLRKAEPLPFKLENLLESVRPNRVNQPAWTAQDAGLFYAMTVGCVRYWRRLNAWITHLSQCDWKRLEPTVGACLRLGLFQLFELDDVPDYAAVSSTLEVAEALRVSKKSRGFINGVLRSATRANGVTPFPTLEADPLGFLTTQGSLPQWWAERLLKRHSVEEISGLLKAYSAQTGLSLRVNTLKTSVVYALASLHDADIPVIQPDMNAQEMLLLPNFKGLPTQIEGYLDGLYYTQEPSSALVARFLNPQPNERVLDLCAAPGSKTSHLAALMNNTGTIVALEPKAKRLAILQDNLDRLGVTHATCLPLRGEALLEKPIATDYPVLGQPFDKVLVDAPCSGLGTIRKHPELLLTAHETHIMKQAPLQKNLLEAGLSALKVGGTLVYSTCSNEPEETDAVIEAVLATHPEVTLAERIERLPHANGTVFGDGFTLFRLIKSE
ncbi:MAG: transcription antitermination factor NusB [Vampirovibrionales bacterium]|nr:transcription antitermination factor NusB [Vampirovibrionales bacterium]